jgi:hypothetical protein
MVSFMPLALYQRRRSPRYALEMRLIGPHSRSGRMEKRITSCPYRESNPNSGAHLVARRYTNWAIMFLEVTGNKENYMIKNVTIVSLT